MKVFEIINLDTKKKYYVSNKTEFYKENNLTRRLLDYTRSGERNHHKRFVLKPYMVDFIPSEDGEVTIYNSDIKGYVVVESQKIKSDRQLIDKELSIANKKLQSYQDKLRIARKMLREQNREVSVLENFVKDVEDILIHKKFKFKPLKKVFDNQSKSMVVQLSDLHFGKVVNLEHNKFNMSVAQKRLELYSKKIIDIGNRFGVKNILIAITGDLLNLDSHMDSLLTNESNRASCFVEAFEIMLNFINTLADNFEGVSLQGVLGNESRLRTSEYNSNVNKLAENNFDTLMFKLLKKVCKNVRFIGNCDRLHDVIEVSNKRIAITHGDKFKHTKDEVYKFKARVMEQIGGKIDYTIFGHIHSTLITPTFARSGSLVGADEYAFNGLNISESIPSQNIYIIGGEDITPIEVKLGGKLWTKH